MYRAVTLKIIRLNMDINNIEELNKLLLATDVSFLNGKVILDGEDISEEIRMPYVNQRVSDVAAIPEVRIKLVQLQRELAETNDVIMDGRDIGTNVLTNANIKIYLTASVEERAKRRYKELCGKKINVTFEDICKDIANRDKIDSEREVNPLCKAEDAVLLDTTFMNIDEAVNEILNIVKKIEE
jgi:cytidylate kinase